MINLDEGSLICDFAETYSVFDYRALPLNLAATLACGLRADSRIMMKASDIDYPINTIMLASCLDELKFIAWSKTEDAQYGQNRPKSVLNTLLKREVEKENVTFESGSAFEEVRLRMVENIQCQI